jgi:hypothetical protein
MGFFVEVPVGDDSVLVAVQPGEGIQLAARPGDVIATAVESLQQASGRIRSIAAAFITNLEGLPHRPEEIEIEFGLSLSAEAKMFVAATTGEGSFTVRIKWAPTTARHET